MIPIEPKLMFTGSVLGALINRLKGDHEIPPCYNLTGAELSRIRYADEPIELEFMVRPPNEWLRTSS
jgi:hypothetical protein